MIYLIAADGKIPNIAIGRLLTYFRQRGDSVRVLRKVSDYEKGRDPPPSRIYGSAIFTTTASVMRRYEEALGEITWGGTGVRIESNLSEIDPEIDSLRPDFSPWPEFTASVGYLTTGCRLACDFCCVPKKEGKPKAVASVYDLWRGDPYPRHLMLLDNDAFAPKLRDHWTKAVREIREGKFSVCFSQGINLRLIDDESAAALSSIFYVGNDFSPKTRKLYTAWDSISDESLFERGIERLRRAGIKPNRLCVYMLIGFAPGETWEAIFYRYHRIFRELGADPYPNPYERHLRPDLRHFQRWVLGRSHKSVPFPEYKPLPEPLRELITPAWNRVMRGEWKPSSRRLMVVRSSASL